MSHFRSAVKLWAPLVAAALLGSLSTVGASAASAPSTDTSSQQHLRYIHAAGSHAFPASTGAAAAKSSASKGAEMKSLAGVVNRSLSRSHSARAASALSIPNVVPTPVVTTSGATASFSGLNLYQERYVASAGNQFTVTPPDQGLCVGNGFVMETLNDVVRVWSTSGKALTDPIGLNAFYGYPYEINRTTFAFGPEPTDPSCYYDPQYGRWYHVALTLEVDQSGFLTGFNHLDIAVSATASPLDGWTYYHIPVQDDGTQGTPNHTSCPCIGDFPHIGADQFGFYITTNEYPLTGGPGIFGNGYNGAQVYAMSKFQLAQQALVLPVVQIEGPKLNSKTPSFTLWPNEVPGTAFDTRRNGSEWFVQSTATLESLNTTGMSNTIGVWRLINTASLDSATPKLFLGRVTLSSEVYGIPPTSNQKVGPTPLRDCLLINCLPGIGPSTGEVESGIDSSDSRILTDWLAGGKLYAALGTIVSVNGVTQAGVAFFVINTATLMSDVSIANQGYEAVNGNITYPSIATLPNGTGVMALTLVGANYFPTAAYMMVGASGPAGSVTVAKMGAGPDDEFCGYLFYNCGGTSSASIRPRWGDYGAAVVDGNNVWIASEFIGQRCTLSTYQVDPTCGATRAPLGNWDTRISEFSL
jgi:hypothetical protein